MLSQTTTKAALQCPSFQQAVCRWSIALGVLTASEGFIKSVVGSSRLAADLPRFCEAASVHRNCLICLLLILLSLCSHSPQMSLNDNRFAPFPLVPYVPFGIFIGSTITRSIPSPLHLAPVAAAGGLRGRSHSSPTTTDLCPCKHFRIPARIRTGITSSASLTADGNRNRT